MGIGFKCHYITFRESVDRSEFVIYNINESDFNMIY